MAGLQQKERERERERERGRKKDASKEGLTGSAS